MQNLAHRNPRLRQRSGFPAAHASWNAAPPKGATASRAGQVVDALPVGIGAVRPDRFGDQHAPPETLEQACVIRTCRGCSRGSPHRRRRCRTRLGVVRMDHHRRPRSRAQRGRGLGEARIEEVARRRGRQPERMLASASSITAQWSGSAGIVAMGRIGPSFATARSASPAGSETCRPARRSRRGNAPSRNLAGSRSTSSRSSSASVPQPEFCRVRSMISRARHGEAADARRRGAAASAADDVMVRAAFAGRLDQLRPEHDILVAAAW